MVAGSNSCALLTRGRLYVTNNVLVEFEAKAVVLRERKRDRRGPSPSPSFLASGGKGWRLHHPQTTDTEAARLLEPTSCTSRDQKVLTASLTSPVARMLDPRGQVSCRLSRYRHPPLGPLFFFSSPSSLCSLNSPGRSKQ